MVSPLTEIHDRVLALNDDGLPQRYGVDGPTIRATWKFDDPTWAPKLTRGAASQHYALIVRLEPTIGTYRVTESQTRGAGRGAGRSTSLRGASLDVAAAFREMLRRRGASATYKTASVVEPVIRLLESDGWTNRGTPAAPPRGFSPRS
jgi:hypothetical protein